MIATPSTITAGASTAGSTYFRLQHRSLGTGSTFKTVLVTRSWSEALSKFAHMLVVARVMGKGARQGAWRVVGVRKSGWGGGGGGWKTSIISGPGLEQHVPGPADTERVLRLAHVAYLRERREVVIVEDDRLELAAVRAGVEE